MQRVEKTIGFYNTSKRVFKGRLQNYVTSPVNFPRIYIYLYIRGATDVFLFCKDRVCIILVYIGVARGRGVSVKIIVDLWRE